MNTLPIDHLSYSSMKLLCSNPWQFKKNYILGIWDFKQSVTAFIGEAGHNTLQAFYSGETLERAIKIGVQQMENTPDAQIDFGKTGSRAKALQDFNNAINCFMAERPDIGEVLGVEKTLMADVVIDDMTAPLPIKARTDLVSRKDGKIWIWDWKFVSAFSDKDEEKADFIMQAIFNYQTIQKQFGEAPVGMNFVEIKKSKSKDGRQVEIYEILFENHPEYMELFKRMYVGVIRLLANPDMVFLPNFGDTFTGKDAWKDFAANTMDFAMPTQVSHKSLMTVNIDEKKFVESKLNNPNSRDLRPEEKIELKLQEFGIPVDFVQAYEGANVTMYTFLPSRGVSMAQISKYEDDLALALESKSVRIEAPIRGTKFVGVEVANETQKTVMLDSSLFHPETIDIPVGQDVYGKPYYIDLASAPHLLVAGATGAGKSVFLNGLIRSLIAQNSPEAMKLILIDPKQTELIEFESSPHLSADIITSVKDAELALRWCIVEMEQRYTQFKDMKVRNVDDYNKVASMSKIVVVIDEFADLRLSPESTEIEGLVVRIAQKSRAAGIHLVVATQRPSVDVVTGILKANFPTRVAFMTSSRADSMVILDQKGAEQLVGKGDMLLMNPKERGLIRLKGYYYE